MTDNHCGVDVSVVIPTHGRPERVANCVRALGEQIFDPERFEVLVGIDGRDDQSEPALRAEWRLDPDRLRVVHFAHQGQASVRNHLIEHVRGRVIVFLNDDMIPSRKLLGEHAAAQRASDVAGRRDIVIGDSPWVRPASDTLFDRLIGETSMVFFYDRMHEHVRVGGDPHHDWGFRHAWLLNLSAPTSLVTDLDGFSVFPSTYGYEDDEFAFRASKRAGSRVVFRPDALALHDHAYTPAAYLQREFRLGHAAWGFASTAPECAHAMFRRDVTAPEFIAYCRGYVQRERRDAMRVQQGFERLADLPSSAIAGAQETALIDVLYQQHLLLKRWVWRAGLVAAADGLGHDAVELPDQAACVVSV